jgi:glycerol kinase
LLTTVGFQLSGQKAFYAQEGSVNAAGSALEWLIKLNLTNSVTNLDKMISQEANKSNGVVFVPAFSGLFCPYWRPDARGVILGLTLGTSSANIMYAALEAIALQVEDILKVLRQNGVKTEIMAVDGGIVNSVHFRQILSNILKVKVELRDMVEVKDVIILSTED